MNISVEHLGSLKKDMEFPEGSRVQDVLDHLRIIYSFVITMLNERPVPIDEELKDGDVLKVVTVVSGG